MYADSSRDEYLINLSKYLGRATAGEKKRRSTAWSARLATRSRGDERDVQKLGPGLAVLQSIGNQAERQRLNPGSSLALNLQLHSASRVLMTPSYCPVTSPTERW